MIHQMEDCDLPRQFTAVEYVKALSEQDGLKMRCDKKVLLAHTS